MSGPLDSGDRRRTAWFPALALLAAALTAAGCASVTPYRTHPELPQDKGGIRTVGLVPPAITMSEEQARFGLNKVVDQVVWSSVAADAVSRAFAAEMADDHTALVPIDADDPEAKDLIELYNAVEFSIQRHAWENETGRIPPREPFPEKVRTFDYSVGPARALMDRHHLDAVWIVRGFNLLPTTGARAKEGAEVLLSILGALGGVATPVLTLQKIELRVALIDKTGSILYYGVADEKTGPPTGEPVGEAAPGERPFLAVDLRDPRGARHYVHAALAGYRAAAP